MSYGRNTGREQDLKGLQEDGQPVHGGGAANGIRVQLHQHMDSRHDP